MRLKFGLRHAGARGSTAGSLNLTVSAACLSLLLSIPAHAYTFKTLHHFTGKSDGGEPLGGVTEYAGTLYGETWQGGAASCTGAYKPSRGCGTIYSLSRDGVFTTLATFTGANGAHGNIAPVLIGKILFGATQYGGAGDKGEIFSVNTDGTGFTILHAFTGSDGELPNALVATAQGLLYGTTQGGGSSNQGVLFSITTAGEFSILHDFALPESGNPSALLAGPGNTLVGSTLFGGAKSQACLQGCGAIYQYGLTTGNYLNLITYASSGLNGYKPYIGSIGPGPTIYGANQVAIFATSHSGGYVNLADLNVYTIGSGANSGPTYTPAGTLYGVLGGSITGTDGLIYSLTNGVVTDLYLFAGTLNGRSGSGPSAKPIVTRSGSVIGTTDYSGDCTYCGTIWEYKP